MRHVFGVICLLLLIYYYYSTKTVPVCHVLLPLRGQLHACLLEHAQLLLVRATGRHLTLPLRVQGRRLLHAAEVIGAHGARAAHLGSALLTQHDLAGWGEGGAGRRGGGAEDRTRVVEQSGVHAMGPMSHLMYRMWGAQCHT